MASFHSRSNSLPSKSHPVMDEVENLLCRLNSSQSASTSSSINSLCSNLASLKDLHEEINNMIQLPSLQQALLNEQGEKWMNELLEGSLGLVDLCGFSRDMIYATKEAVQELESSIRRNGGKSAASVDINAYVASRKKIIKKVDKRVKNLKSFNLQPKDDSDITKKLKEAQALDFSILKSVMMLLSKEKESSTKRNWSLLSKFTQSSRVHSQETETEEELCFLNIPKSTKSNENINMLKQLRSSEMIIQELEEGLEALFKSLVKTRVSLLNLLSH